jgi:hypothetical protein
VVGFLPHQVQGADFKDIAEFRLPFEDLFILDTIDVVVSKGGLGIVVIKLLKLVQIFGLVYNGIHGNAWVAADMSQMFFVERGVTGKAGTPFLLGFIVEESGGKSLEVNLDLARNNVRVAGEIAKAWAEIQ